MGVLVAQEFEVVRREIDDEQTPAGPQHARRLADGAGAVVEEVQDLMDDDDVEGIARHREIVDVAVAHAAMLETGAVRRARASASMSRERSRPRPRSISPAKSSSIRPVPVPRSSSVRIGLSRSAARDRRFTAASAT